ncbi:heme lyase CcmF/NrfE family subunit [Henriciella pelagia]|jgi:cytochrome c-type biogenesis protein CcmF|uniref:C-type cytochrome biogenesis protein CcmF n=1 Tax=Henriciella pelagia TaxID=1977912 RepID=A0ABQ1J351_9PROT|nr:heme lyase CcmF/NrfE family subunit [Henriciella pelagia]GGB56892.1 c-type cytochrome biogenesis protein CcmF [Henriciella pelagia]
MIEAGHFAAILALVFSAVQAFTGLRGNRGQSGLFAQLAFAAMVFAFFTLLWAFARSDFSVQLVAANSHTLKPFVYKLAGTWGNHEGSMALWCVVGLGFGAAGAWLLKSDRPVFEARALGVQGILSLSSLLYLLLASSPFTRLDPAPLQGQGLNPLLQDPALAIHPPMLYLGYVGYSFVFALAAAGLIEKRVDRQWAKTARPWALAAFVPLSLGIALGSYWAYYELGWGGWWFWDPVENASLMPWLIGAALMHSIIVTEKRGSFAAWTSLLAVLAFCFSLLGAFLVRSGVLTSVHAFAVDPLRGSFLLGGLLVLGGSALLLFALRAPKLKGGPDWLATSREGALMGNNLILTVATATVLLGTLFPLIAEAAGQTISVGEPYFNLTFTPIMALALLALPVVQAWAWGKADLSSLWKWAGGFAGLVALFWLAGIGPFDIPLMAGIGLALGVWLIVGAGQEMWRRAKSLGRLPKMPLRVWGMTLAHAGLGLFVIGAVLQTSGRTQTTLALEAGESANIAGWTVTLEDVRSIEGPNWYADRAHLIATKPGTKAELNPQKRYYPAARMPTTETAIHKTGTADLYVALGDGRRAAGGPTRWTFEVFVNPLIDFIYVGVILIGLGGALAMFDRRGSGKVS